MVLMAFPDRHRLGGIVIERPPVWNCYVMLIPDETFECLCFIHWSFEK